MKYELAEEILKMAMTHWKASEKSKETQDIQIISELKYDDYQQFTHGMRYIESLALWLRQFDTTDDKICAYDLVKNKLVYVSVEEMRQLVTNAYPMKMHRYIMEKTRAFCDKRVISDVGERQDVYRFFRRSSLFLGLSDGSHMDYFRRQNPKLSNEQIFVHYDFSESKAKDMRNSLMEDGFIQNFCNKFNVQEQCDFTTIFLLDDFSGSGRSFIRKDGKSWHGKINTFFKRLKASKFKVEQIEIHLVLYVATHVSLNYLKESLNEFVNEHGYKPVSVEPIQFVKPIDWSENVKLKQLLKENYDKYVKKGYKSFVDKHFEKGNGKEYYLGFADGSLPLILYHNTPNNSLPVLWYTWNEEEAEALFLRIMRHKEN